jgi:large subunit ribosomal protein L23
MSVKETSNPSLYDVVRFPVITEKSQMGAEFNKATFVVSPDATKKQVALAVESLFGAKVVKVNMINVKGKTKVFRGIRGRRKNTKKAIVTLAEGQELDVTAGV